MGTRTELSASDRRNTSMSHIHRELSREEERPDRSFPQMINIFECLISKSCIEYLNVVDTRMSSRVIEKDIPGIVRFHLIFPLTYSLHSIYILVVFTLIEGIPFIRSHYVFSNRILDVSPLRFHRRVALLDS